MPRPFARPAALLALLLQGSPAEGSPGNFPAMEARTLDGRDVALPRHFGAGVLIVSFRREDFESTVAWRKGLVARVAPARQVWSVPVFPASIRLLRPLIEGGIRRRHTVDELPCVVPVWGDPPAVRRSSGLGDDERVAVIVLDHSGAVRHVARGEPGPAALDAVGAAATLP